MTYVPIVPFIPMGGGSPGGPLGKPPWLKLEQDEVFVRAYGGPQAARAKRPVIGVAIGLVLLVFMGVVNLYYFSRSKPVVPAIEPADPIPWIAIAVAAVLVLNVGIVVAVIAATKRKKAAAYLTTKMLIIMSGKDYAGVRLADVTAIKQGTGAEQDTLLVFARTAQQPVAQLPVEDPAAALAELAAYSKAEGAKLQ